jgi:hypothetical protein
MSGTAIRLSAYVSLSCHKRLMHETSTHQHVDAMRISSRHTSQGEPIGSWRYTLIKPLKLFDVTAHILRWGAKEFMYFNLPSVHLGKGGTRPWLVAGTNEGERPPNSSVLMRRWHRDEPRETQRWLRGCLSTCAIRGTLLR